MRLWFMAAIVSAFISVSFKVLADFFLPKSVHIIGEWLFLDHTLNPGLAFGVVLPPILQYLFIGVALITVLWFSLQWYGYPLYCIGMGLILGGGISNLLDRLFDGFVTDFIVLWPFPNFNVADITITIGALFLIIGEFWPKISQKALAGSLGK